MSLALTLSLLTMARRHTAKVCETNGAKFGIKVWPGVGVVGDLSFVASIAKNHVVKKVKEFILSRG